MVLVNRASFSFYRSTAGIAMVQSPFFVVEKLILWLNGAWSREAVERRGFGGNGIMEPMLLPTWWTACQDHSCSAGEYSIWAPRAAKSTRSPER